MSNGMRARIVRIILFTAGTLLLSLHDAGAEYVFLKNGTILRGSIMGETGSFMRVRSPGSETRVIQRSHILRVLYAELYLGRMVVRLTDGSVIEAYMVDENADCYTFRNSLEDPLEFTIPRKRVLFMARTNPTDLTGKSLPRSLRLTWNSPYRRPSFYRIYLRERDGGAYARVKTSRGASCHIRGLKVKTWYRAKVTAVARSGMESLPSDELEIMTNAPPHPPARPGLRRCTGKGGEDLAHVTWGASGDPDGTVVLYRLYALTATGWSQIGETVETERIIPNPDPRHTRRLAIRAVDNDGTESDDAPITIVSAPLHFEIDARGCVLAPLGRMARILRPGFGTLASIRLLDLPAGGLTLGPGIGLYWFQGKGDTIREAWMAPLCMACSYRFSLTEFLSIAPELMAGANYVHLKKSSKDAWIRPSSRHSRMGYEPFAMGGLQLSYGIGKRILLHVGTHYAMIFEKRIWFEYISCDAGIGVRI
ncbi:MAG: fibronectin type III domain-containing protein [Spirochaetes bacterium]|nr:fibronectin type III domain-containing protein [Spirochaetota bacterium]